MWAGLAAVVVLALVVVLLAAEGFVRVRQWYKYGTLASYEHLYQEDPVLKLRVLRAGAREGTISINSLGFRGPEIPRDKPAHRLRIAFLGASTTYCAEVSSDAAVWPHQAIEMLGRRFPGVEFDYVNGGAPGYRVEASLTNLRHRVGVLKPDVIVIYHATNDLSGELRRLAEEAGIFKPSDLMRHGIDEYSLLYELLRKNLRVMAAERQAADAKSILAFDPARLGEGFRADLTRLVEESRRVAPVVAVATFATHLRPEHNLEQQRRAAVSALVVMPFMSLPGLVDGYRRYNDVIREVGRSTGAMLIEGENDIPGDPAHFVDTVHFTDAGARRMAERVVGVLATAPEFLRLAESRRR
ncbi:MAG: SGNH/GDSL hydrolase family protein [Alphaproteobacteria bacterium]|nr:SGNH/GDSL hydrolase family protein [Alphaproteobacteria bacterium]